METLFVFGTLRFSKYQKEAFGRAKKGIPDILPGYVRGQRKWRGELYPVIRKKKNYSVRGLVLHMSKKELKRCDAYEDEMYIRKRVRLKSGLRVWVYALRKE